MKKPAWIRAARYLVFFVYVVSAQHLIEDRVWGLKDEVVLRTDSYWYASVAYKFIESGRVFHSQRPPGYPLVFLGANGFVEHDDHDALTEANAPAVVAFQRWAQLPALLVFAGLLLWLTGSLVLSTIVSTLMMLHLGFQLYVHTALTEGLSNMLLVLVLAAFALYVKRPTRSVLALLGLLCTYWVLLRPNHWMLFLVMLTVWIFARALSPRRAVLLFSLVSIIPFYYSYRNYRERRLFTYSMGSTQTYVFHVASHHRWYRKIQNKSSSVRQALAYIDEYGRSEPPSRVAILSGPILEEKRPWREVVTVYRDAVFTGGPKAIVLNFRDFALKLYRFFAYEHLQGPKGRLPSGHSQLAVFNGYIRLLAGIFTLAGLFWALLWTPGSHGDGDVQRLLMLSAGSVVLVFWLFQSFFIPNWVNNARYIYAIHSTLFLGSGLFLGRIGHLLKRGRPVPTPSAG